MVGFSNTGQRRPAVLWFMLNVEAPQHDVRCREILHSASFVVLMNCRNSRQLWLRL